jgi:hypothetical protein
MTEEYYSYYNKIIRRVNRLFEGRILIAVTSVLARVSAEIWW